MSALARIQAELAKPATLAVEWTYADGTTERHDVHSELAAQRWFDMQSAKIGKPLISRNADFTAGPTVYIQSVRVIKL